MKHIKLFESFKSTDKNDDANVSISKAKRKTEGAVKEAKENNYTASKVDKDYEKRLDALFKKLVPATGAAKTMEGEMVRAVARVGYRYMNDGDYFFRGYGKETVKPSVDWLRTQSPLKDKMRSIWSAAQKNAPKRVYDNKYEEYEEYEDMYDVDKDGYLMGIRAAIKATVDYVESLNGKYTPNSGHDSR